MLKRLEEELPSASVVAKADDLELQKIVEHTTRSTGDFIAQLDDPLGDSLDILCASFWALARC